MAASDRTRALRSRLLEGLCIPAHPLALTADRTFDERRQRALTRYYLAAGAGGLAVGVHTTQFAIRDPRFALLQPVLDLAIATARAAGMSRAPLMISGVCGETPQATAEAELALDLGYDAGLVSLGAMSRASDRQLVAHCAEVAAVIPIVGFYLQPAVGGRVLGYEFWRALVDDVEPVVAIKIAPFNRYQTIDVVRAVAESGREDIALYTGNDDSIVADLVTPFETGVGAARRVTRIVGGLLGQWAVWTRTAVDVLERAKREATTNVVSAELLRTGAALTDANAAIFDARHGFAGCIAGIHEVLRRQGLMAGIWCLDEHEGLSPGQAGEIDRVIASHPELTDDVFVATHLHEWLD